MIDIFILLGILIAVALSGFFSGIETAAYSVNTVDIHARANAGNNSAMIILRMLTNMPRLITTMLIGTNLSIFIATNLVTNFFVLNSYKNAEFLTTLILTPFCFLFAESIPKRVAFEIPNTSLLISARVLQFCEVVFYPIAVILSGLGSLLQYILDKKGSGNSEIIGKVRLYESLEAKTAEGRISSDQYQMASRVMEHENTTIAELMLDPLVTFTVTNNMNCYEAGRAIRKNGYARALVCDENKRFTGDIITINSIMNIDDMYITKVEAASDKAVLLNRKTSVLHAISMMREAGARTAIVTSRNGVYIGSVQMNNLLNSIVRGLNDQK